MLAPFLDAALVAFGFACLADVATVEQQPMVGARDEFVGEMLGEFLFDSKWSRGLFVDKSEAMGHAEDVGIDSKGGFVPDDSLNDIGSLSAHARQTYEVVEVVGHFAAEVLHEHLRHAHEVGGFGVGIRHTLDVFIDDFGRRCGHDLRRRKVCKERRRHEIDTTVGALCRQDDRTEQLKRILILQFRFDLRHRLQKIRDEVLVLFFFAHEKQGLSDIATNLREVALHTVLILCVDDGDEFLHLGADLLHLVLGVGVEEDFAEQCVVLAQHALGNLHVALEGGAGSVLMLHHCGEGEGGDEGNRERVGDRLVMLLERVFEDVEAESLVEVFEEAAAHVVALVDDDGVFVREFAEIGKRRAEHRVGRNVVEARRFVKLLETSLHRGDVAEDAVFLGQVRNDLAEDVERIFQAHAVDDEVGTERVDFVERGETLRVVEKTHALRIDVIDGDFVVETQQVGEEGAHFSGSENEDFHIN